MSKKHHHGLQPGTGYSVAYWEANRSQLDAGPAFNILDTASNIGAALNALNTDSHIAQIVISDNASVTVSVSQLTGDATALSKLVNGNGTAAALTVSDTAANIQASFATIATEGQVTKIVISDNNIVTLTASQAAYTTAVAELVNGNLTSASVHVKDTAANLATNLNAIQADGSAITEVIVSNSTAMTLTAQQVSQDAGALAKVAYNNGGTVQFKVNDTGANIGTYLDALQAQTKITTIIDSNNAAITLTVAQITSDSGALVKVVNANASSYTLTVADNAADVAGDVSGLNGNSHVSSIAISDSSADVVSNLNALAGVTKTMTITLTDGGTPTLTITDTQFTNDSGALNDITSAYNLAVTGVTVAGAGAIYADSHVASFVVTDSSANVQNGIDSLESYASKISSITLTDGGTPTLTISETQYHNDTTVLGDISGGFTLALTGVLAADAAALAGGTVGNGTVTQLYVSDTASNIASNLSGLDGADIVKTVISNGSAIQINVASLEANGTALDNLYASNGTDQGTVTIYDTASAIAADLAGLNSDLQVTKIVVSDDGLTTVTIGELTSYAHALNELYESDGTTPAQLTVTDTASNISGAFDTLNGASRVSQIIVSDSGTGGVVTIDAAQAANDGLALSELYLANGTTHAQVVVSDTSGNVQSSLDGLEANHSHISSITLTDGGTPTLTITETQYHNDATVLGDIGGSYDLAVTNVLAADAATVSGGSHVTSVSVTDTAADIASAFDTLNGIGGKLVAINVQDEAEVTLSAHSAATDTSAESILSGGSSSGHVAVSDTAANVVSYASELNANSYVNQVYVVDSAANVTSNIGGLNSVTNLSIDLTDVGTPLLTISYANLADTMTLDAISNASFDIAVANVLATNASAIAGAVSALTSHAALTSISVTDTASAISSAFGTLNGVNHLTQIIVSDSGSNEVTLSASAAISDTAAESLLVQSNGSTPADVAVSDNAANVAGSASSLNGNTHINNVHVVDSASAVASNLGGLNGVNHLSITLNDGGTPLLAITESQLTGDTAALDAISNVGFDIAVTNVLAADASSIAGDVGALTSHATLTSITVNDTAAHIAAAFNSLNATGDLAKIIVSDSGSNEVTLSVASVLADTTAEGLLYNSNGSTPAKIAVADTAINIANNLTAIQDDSQINNIYVADTAANISSQLASLGGLSYLTGILITDGGTLSVTESDLTTYASAIGLITNANFNIAVTSVLAADASGIAADVTSVNSHAVLTSITVDDSAASVSSAFDSLSGVAHLAQVIVTDSGSNEVTVSAESAANDTAVESVLYQSNGSTHADFAISDTAANVAEYLGQLNGLSSLSAINLISGTLTITEAQLENDTAALGKITTAGFTVAVTNVVAADVGGIAAEVTAANGEAVLTSISVTDTAADVASAFDTLNSASGVTQIIVSDSGSHEVTLSVSSALTDTAAEGMLYQSNGSTPAHVAVSDNAGDVAANASNLNANGHIDHVHVTDSAANVVSNLGGLNGVDNLSITLTGSGTPLLTVTESELTGDTAALNAIANASFDIVVTNVVAADAGSIAGDVAALTSHATLTSISVTDTAANISSAFNSLNATAHLTQVVVSDSGSGNEVQVSVAQLGDTSLLGELYDANGTTSASVTIFDTASDITASLAALNSDAQVNKIVVSDNGLTAVSIAQLTAYAHALGELYESDGVTPAELTVTDTAANISAAIDTLNGASRVAKIIVDNSGAGGVVTIDVAQAGDTHALSGLYQADGTDHAYATVADTASNISADFGDLVNNPYVNKFDVTDNAALTITANQATGYSGSLGEFFQSNGSTPATIDVVDTASHIAANFDNLGGIGLTKIIVSDSGSNEVTLSASSAVNDTAAEAILYQSNGTSPAHVAVLDTAADISGVLDQLNSNTHVDHIVVSDDGAITLGAASAVNDSHALGELTNEDLSPVSLIVSDTAANIATYLNQLNAISNVSSVVISDSNPLELGAAQVSNDSTILGKLAFGSSIEVSDTAANLSEYLDALATNNDVISITDTNNGALTVTVDQLDTYAVVLSEITNNDGITAATIDVEDTAANIQAHIADLNNNPTPQEIIISDNAALALSVSQYTTDTSLLARLQNANGSPYTLNISDNGANISAALDSLGGDSHVATITDTNEAAITLTVAQISSDAAALGILVNGDGSPYTLSVNDTAADISAALGSLNGNGHVTSIVVTDSGSHELVVSVAQVTSDAHALSLLYDADGVTPASVTVSDVAANIQGALATLSDDTQVNKVIVTDSASSEIRVSVAQLTTDANLLSELYDADGITPANVTVSDTAANLSSGAFDTLNSNSQVNKIIVSDSGSGNEVNISVTQLANDTVALGELYEANGTTHANVTVLDTAADISAAFGTLNGDSQVNKIVVSDSASNEVTLSVSGLSSYPTALAELCDANGTTPADVTVSDTAADISAALGSLNSAGRVNKIVVSDSASHHVVVSVAQISSDAHALAELYAADGATQASVGVSDTAADISAALDSLASDSQVYKIVVTDSASNEVTVSVAQVTSDAAALAELYTSGGITLADVTVSDTAADISAALNGLNGNTQINKIIVSDSGSNEVVVNVAQLTGDATALGELYNAGGVTHANVVVSDVSYNISLAFDSLNGDSQVNRIIVSDSGSGNEVTLQVAQLTSDAHALSELYQSDGHTLADVYINDTAANISAAFDALNNDGRINGIVINDGGTVTITASQAYNDTTALGELYQGNLGDAVTVEVLDSAANIQAQLGNLNGNTHVGSIVVTDTQDFQLSAVQVGTDSRALGLIGADNSGVTIEVTDTGANITTYLDALEANSDITSITISDNSAITVSAVQLLSTDVDAIGLLVNADTADYPNVSLVVDDSAADISAHLSDLAGYSSAGREITSVVISDNAAVAVTIGQLTTDGSIISELSNANGSPYTLDITGNAATISADLGLLETYAAGTHVASITITDSAPVGVNVAEITSDAAALAKLSNASGGGYSLVVTDVAANLSGSEFDALNGNSHVSQIIVSDSGSNEVTVSVAQLTSDAAALAELYDANGTTPANVTVSDTASDISAALNGLNGNTQVNKIIVSNSGSSEVTVSVAQLTSDAAALAELYNANGSTPANVTVSDTAADISAALSSLNGNSQVNKIVVSDSASHEVTVSVAQLTSDAAVLAELYDANGTTPADVTVSDTAADIQGALGALNGNSQVNKIIVSDSSSHHVVVSVAQLTSDANALSELYNADGSTQASVRVYDTASDISAALNSLSSDSQVYKIVVSDSGSNEVTVSVAQLTSDAAALSELYTSGGITLANVTVVDTAADVSAALNSLNSNTQVNKIIVSDSGSNEVTVSVAQLTSDAAALAELYDANGTTPANVTVSDTASDISAALNGLNGNTQVNKIIVSNSGSSEVTVSVAQLTSDAAALAELYNANGSTPANVTVSDTAADISAALSSLNGNSQVNKIVVSDSASHEVTVSVAQLPSDAAVLAELYDANGTTPADVTVSDTAADIQGALGALNGNSQVNKIIVSDSSSHHVVVSVAQLTSDANALSELYNADGSTQASVRVYDTASDISAALNSLSSDSQVYKIVVSDSGSNEVTVSVAQLTSDAAALSELYTSGGITLANVTVVDTAADVSAALNSLNSNTQVNKIIISNNAPLNLAAAQAVNDSTALNELQNQNGSPVSLTVTDTAANIATYLDALNGIATVSAITISDNNPLILHAYQAASDTTALGKLGNSNGQPIVINVSDLAANISTYLNQLEANNYIGTITVSDNLSVTVATAQLTTDSDVLAALVNGNGSAATVTVLDTAANISADLGSLNTDSQVTSLVISNNAQLDLNVAQVVNDTHALGELHNANGLGVTEKVSDSAANIQAYLSNLQADSLITSIVVSNNVALTLTAAEIANDGSALSEVSNKNGGAVSFKVVDTAANITTYLNALAGNAKISTITVSDNNSVALSVAQIASDAATLAKLVNQNGNPYTLTVEDVAANLSGSAFDTLNGNTHVTSIVVSDNNAVTISVSQLENDTRALAELSNLNGSPYALTVTDTAADISADLSGLNGNSHVQKIVVSNSGSGGTITLSVSQAVANSTALNEMYQANGASHFQVGVSDTSSNISTYLNSLESIAADLGTITITDNGYVAVNVAQVVADAAVLAKMQYTGGYAYGLSLSDTAADISANIAALGANGHIESVTVTDGGVVTSTYALYTQYNSLFYDIQGTHYLDITNVTGQPYTSFTETINATHQLLQQDFYNSGGTLIEQLQYTYNGNGTETINGSNIVGQPYTSFVQNLNAQHQETSATYYTSNGSIYESQTFTYNGNGTVSESITGLSGINLETILFDSGGHTENEFVYYSSNTATAYFFENGQTFTSNGETTGINIENGTSGHTFNLNGSFGEVVVYNYLPGSETLNWDHNDFANIAAVEAHTQAYGSNGTIVTLDSHDYLILQGVTVAQFEAHTSDWHFI